MIQLVDYWLELYLDIIGVFVNYSSCSKFRMSLSGRALDGWLKMSPPPTRTASPLVESVTVSHCATLPIGCATPTLIRVLNLNTNPELGFETLVFWKWKRIIVFGNKKILYLSRDVVVSRRLRAARGACAELLIRRDARRPVLLRGDKWRSNVIWPIRLLPNFILFLEDDLTFYCSSHSMCGHCPTWCFLFGGNFLCINIVN